MPRRGNGSRYFRDEAANDRLDAGMSRAVVLELLAALTLVHSVATGPVGKIREN
jgi:hypothetical protein